jgi:DNA (cytosine-5)-methyltransferase 1
VDGRVNVDLSTIALCTGYGGIEIGLAAACEHVGWKSRVACYVEREVYAAALLAARMEAQSLDGAPIWSDLTTFDATAWRGSVDCITAGFPCQPHSQAGKRKGTDDERWIWPDIARIILESGAWLVVLENVPGLLSSGGFGPVLADLAEMGFAAEWGMLSAEKVGASQLRERVFVVAYARHKHQHVQQWLHGHESARGCGTLGNANSEHRQWGGQRSDESRRQESDGHAAELAGGSLFAPDRESERWGTILAERPDLAPAIESGLCVLVDGDSCGVDQHRSHQLRLCGNGVVPLCAATAIVVLLRRLGLTE